MTIVAIELLALDALGVVKVDEVAIGAVATVVVIFAVLETKGIVVVLIGKEAVVIAFDVVGLDVVVVGPVVAGVVLVGIGAHCRHDTGQRTLTVNAVVAGTFLDWRHHELPES